MIAILSIVMLAGLPSPASELHASLVDVLQISPSDRPFIRYLSLYAIPPDQRATAREVASFWVNSLSRRPRIIRPAQVSDTLLRVDLRDYEWDLVAWENLAQKRGYEFVPVWRSLSKTARDPFQTVSPVLRLEGFLTYSSDKPFYDSFLKLGGKLADVQSTYRIRIDDAVALKADIYGSKFRSPVALHNRRLIRYPSLTGYWWESQDHLSDFDEDNIIDNLEVSKHDAGEFIWTLANGLQAYYIADGQGNAVQVVPAAIAQDYETTARDKQIYSARSCVGCHGLGINAFTDDVSSMINSKSLKLETYDRNNQQRIEDRFLTNLADTISKDQARFGEAVSKACNLKPEVVAHEFRRMTVQYLDQPITPEMAATELGIPVEDLGKLSAPYRRKRILLATFAALLARQGISRQAWEDLLGDAIAIVNQVEAVAP